MAETDPLFIAKVREMREYQKAYFAAQYPSAEKQHYLKMSKAAEKVVDSMLAALYPKLNLFDTGEENGHA